MGNKIQIGSQIYCFTVRGCSVSTSNSYNYSCLLTKNYVISIIMQWVETGFKYPVFGNRFFIFQLKIVFKFSNQIVVSQIWT